MSFKTETVNSAGRICVQFLVLSKQAAVLTWGQGICLKTVTLGAVQRQVCFTWKLPTQGDCPLRCHDATAFVRNDDRLSSADSSGALADGGGEGVWLLQAQDWLRYLGLGHSAAVSTGSKLGRVFHLTSIGGVGIIQAQLLCVGWVRQSQGRTCFEQLFGAILV